MNSPFRKVELPVDEKAIKWAEKLLELLADRDVIPQVMAAVVVHRNGKEVDFLLTGLDENRLLLLGALERLKLRVMEGFDEIPEMPD